MKRTIKIFLILSLCAGCSKEKSLSQVAWEDNVNNPENREFVVEVAFNENVEIWQVTQAQFNERYDIGQ